MAAARTSSEVEEATEAEAAVETTQTVEVGQAPPISQVRHLIAPRAKIVVVAVKAIEVDKSEEAAAEVITVRIHEGMIKLIREVLVRKAT